MIGKNEILWETSLDINGDIQFVITSPPDRSTYYLYVIHDGDTKRVMKDKSPLVLKEKARRKFGFD